MKHIRMFENTEQAAAVLAELQYPTLSAIRGESGIALKPGVPPVPPTPVVDPTTPFYIEDISGSDNIVQIKKNNSSAPTLTIEKSLDGETWESMGSTSTTALTAIIPANGKLYLRCSINAWSTSSYYNTINTTGDCNVGGNIMSLLYGSNFTGEETTFPSGSSYNFNNLFSNNTYLVDASNLLLPATTLADYCYQNMFYCCTLLTAAPALPATTLTECCYYQMFRGCTALTAAPALPATTLAVNCYYNIFYGCTALTAAPTLSATTLANGCYVGMFTNCTSLTTAPALPATTLANNCYSSMFSKCTALTTAPVLPATTLAQKCYQTMFFGCTSLNYIKCLATDISASNCTYNWTKNGSASGTFVKAASMSDWTTGTSGIPSGWTVQDAA